MNAIAQIELMDNVSSANLIGIKPVTLSTWRSLGRYGIPFVKVGRKVMYRRQDLIDWLESRTRLPGSTSRTEVAR